MAAGLQNVRILTRQCIKTTLQPRRMFWAAAWRPLARLMIPAAIGLLPAVVVPSWIKSVQRERFIGQVAKQLRLKSFVNQPISSPIITKLGRIPLPKVVPQKSGFHLAVSPSGSGATTYLSMAMEDCAFPVLLSAVRPLLPAMFGPLTMAKDRYRWIPLHDTSLEEDAASIFCEAAKIVRYRFMANGIQPPPIQVVLDDVDQLLLRNSELDPWRRILHQEEGMVMVHEEDANLEPWDLSILQGVLRRFAHFKEHIQVIVPTSCPARVNEFLENNVGVFHTEQHVLPSISEQALLGWLVKNPGMEKLCIAPDGVESRPSISSKEGALMLENVGTLMQDIAAVLQEACTWQYGNIVHVDGYRSVAHAVSVLISNETRRFRRFLRGPSNRSRSTEQMGWDLLSDVDRLVCGHVFSSLHIDGNLIDVVVESSKVTRKEVERVVQMLWKGGWLYSEDGSVFRFCSKKEEIAFEESLKDEGVKRFVEKVASYHGLGVW